MLPKCFPSIWMCFSRADSDLRQIVPQVFVVLILAMFSVSCGSISASNSNPPHANGQITVSAKLPNATIGTAYNAPISVSGGRAPYAFSVSSGTLPPGLSLSPETGLITGTPTSSGSFNFSVSASDATHQAKGNALVTLPVQSVAFTVSPATASVPSLGIRQFQAAVSGETVFDVTWSANQGAISTSGIFTAPNVKIDTQVMVTASHTTSVGTIKRALTASAVVTVTAVGGSIARISISPSAPTLSSSGTQQFMATISNTSTPNVSWVASQGTISSNGFFTAPAVNQSTVVNVTATSLADPTKSAVAVVTVQPETISVSITPSSAIVASSGTYKFNASVRNTGNTAVTWSASPGAVSTNGLFTAPIVKANTTATVTATSVADRTKWASATVTVTPTVVPSLSITTTTLQSATSGKNYTTALSATGGTLPYSWSLSSGQLPVGLTISSGGLISGTTTPIGQFSLSIRVMDSSSPVRSATQALTLVVDASTTGNGLSSSFFNMHVNHPKTPWPSVPFVGQRLWDADGASWSLINTAHGVYDWTTLDQRFSEAQIHGADILYDLARTPVWAQCGPSTASPCVQTPDCAYSGKSWGGGPGQCYWPADLNADGTGANQHWKDWITALATHSVNSSTARIKYYEIWNEPNDTHFFRGTTAQLVRLTQDAACIIKGIGPGCSTPGIDPSASIVTPAPTLGGGAIDSWMAGFLGTGGSQVVDVLAFHGYNGTDPEKVFSLLATVKSGSLSAYKQTSKPLFDTEFSWGENSPFPDPDERAGFVARALLLHISAGVSRVYWYSWDVSGTMWSPVGTAACTAPDSTGVGYQCQSGVAFSQLQDWTVGTTMNQACSSLGTVWTCGLTKAGGYQALAVWDTAQSCSKGFCTTSTYRLPLGTKYIRYRDLSGNASPISGSTVSIGYKPILLENQ
jgi:hypothetical protein